MSASESPNGSKWFWKECARACSHFDKCEFWTLQEAKDGSCMMMSNKGEFVATGNHSGGDKDPNSAQNAGM